jgi:hypothetical protein
MKLYYVVGSIFILILISGVALWLIDKSPSPLTSLVKPSAVAPKPPATQSQPSLSNAPDGTSGQHYSGNTHSVAAGCAIPGGSGTSFYVDAVNGSDSSGDGSQGKPWKSLQTVLNTKIATQQYTKPYSSTSSTIPLSPTGTVHPGDTILLMSGSYGDISLVGVNNDFITVQAAPGQSPLLKTLTVQGASKWVFHGLKVQSLRNNFQSLVTISTHGFLGPVHNIIFDGNTVSSADDVSAWSAATWLSSARQVGINMDESAGATRDSDCVTITNNRVSNIIFGIEFGIDHSLLANNKIDNFGGDGVDYAASNILLSHNRITNARYLDGTHPDGMQGAIGRLNPASLPGYSNVTIDGNTVIRQTDPSLAFPNGLQGIDAFDGNWTNLTVTNNVVITNAYAGMSFGSVHGGLIANNTVMYDNSTVKTAGVAASTFSRIIVQSSTHEGAPTNDVLVENNVATEVDQATTGATFRNNVAAKTYSYYDSTGKVIYTSKPGTYGS